MTKYLIAALVFLLISSISWAFYITEFGGWDWRIIEFGIGYVFGMGSFTMFVAWLLRLLRIQK